MRATWLPTAALAATLLAAPSPAWAQKAAFSHAVADLAETAAAPGDSGVHARREAVARMDDALAEWDRNLASLETRVRAELIAAPPTRALDLRVELAREYLDRGRLDDAVRELDAVRTLAPRRADLAVTAALALEAAGRQDEAAAAMRTAWSLDPENPGTAYYALQRPGALVGDDRSRAHAALLAAPARPAAPGTLFASVGLITDGFSRTPVAGDAAMAEGFGLLTASRYREAVAALRHGLASGATGGGDSPRGHLEQARANEAAGRFADARREYERALPGTLAARSLLHVGIARLAQVEGDLEGAIRHFSTATRLNPYDPYIHKELASAYAAHGLEDDALTELAAALLIDRNDASAHAAIGQLHLDSGRLAQAVEALTRALQIAPERHETRYALGTALMRLGRMDDARREFAAFERAREDALQRRRRGIDNEVEIQNRRREEGPAPR